MGKVGREDACIQGCCVYKNRTKKLDVKISTDNEGRPNCRAAMSTSKKCRYIQLVTFFTELVPQKVNKTKETASIALKILWEKETLARGGYCHIWAI